MAKNKHPHFNVLTALLVGVALIPLGASTFIDTPEHERTDLKALFRSIDDEGHTVESAPDVREYAKQDRASFRARRRAYSRAVDRCRDRKRAGEEIDCPDFNDTNSYSEDYATTEKEAEVVATEEVVTEEVHAAADTSGLSTTERKMLRSYVRAGFCSDRAGAVVFDLCTSLVNQDSNIPMGFINDNVKLHSMRRSAPASLKLRLQMVDEAISGVRGKRTDGTRPMRPSTR